MPFPFPARLAALSVGVLAASLLPAPAAEGGTTYAVTIDQPASSVSSSVNASAPFSGTMVGENDPMKDPTVRTRTKRFASLFSCGTFGATQNDPINVSATFAASGSSSPTAPPRPAGTFRLGIDPAAGTASVRRLDASLLASGTLTVNASLNSLTYQSFCTVSPSCSAPFLFPISLPVGTIQVTSLLVRQDPGAVAVGTLTPGSGGSYSFSVPVDVVVTTAANFSGSPLALDPAPLQIVVTGTVTPAGTTATVSGSTGVNIGPQANTTPTPIGPSAFMAPADSALCPNINIVVQGTLASTSFTSTNTATISGAGPRVPCPPDFDQNLVVDLLDIFAYLDGWFAGTPNANFNGDGVTDLLDIFAFLGAWFSPPPGC